MSNKGYRQSYRIYRARKTNDGVASQFDFNPDSKFLFLEMAKQTDQHDDKGNALFDWKNKISFKLGVNDIGEILCVLSGKKTGLGTLKDGKYQGLYHKNESGDAILYFDKSEHNKAYYMKLSVRRSGEKKQLSQLISDAEGIILSILLRCIIEAKYDWV